MYSSRQVHIPCPKFYVMYNGTEEQPEHKELRLSDAYDGKGDVEIVAHMLNINKGHNERLMKTCKPLREYSELVDRVRKSKAKELSDKEAIADAIDSCIRDGILTDILRKERARVSRKLYSGLTEEEEKLFYEEEKERDIKEAVDKEREKSSSLTLKLLDLGKYDELKRAASDREYMEKLYELYGI